MSEYSERAAAYFDGIRDAKELAKPADDVRLSMPFIRWQAMAEKLAEAIRSHGPWMDDQCRAVLAEYDAMRLNDGAVATNPPPTSSKLVVGDGEQSDGRIATLPVCEHGQGPCGRCGV